MNRRVQYDQVLMGIVLALLGFGLIMVYSASSLVSGELYGSTGRIFLRQLIFALLGLLALIVSMKIDYHFYERPLFIHSLLALSFGLLVLLLVSPASHGAQRWIQVGPVNFQPSELVKLAVILFTSFYLVKRQEEFQSFWRGLLPYVAVVAPMVLLVLAEPDLGTAVSIALVAGILLFLGGLQYRYILVALLVAAVGVYFSVVRVPYRLSRIWAFWDPEKDPFGIGYQIRQSLIAIGSGGWGGLGYAEGKQKLFFLPEPHTDFIYAVVGEEFGFLGCAALVILFALLFWRGTRIALRADSLFGTYLGLGIVSMILLQAFINISMVIKLLPTKGLPLPLLSVGGSSLVMTMVALGILLNVSHKNRTVGRSKIRAQ